MRSISIAGILAAGAMSALLTTAPPVLAADWTPGVTPIAGDGEGAMPLSTMMKMEYGHLIALGTGMVAGAVLFGPVLGTSELVGVAIGVIAGELLYRSDYWPIEKSSRWFSLSGLTLSPENMALVAQPSARLQSISAQLPPGR